MAENKIYTTAKEASDALRVYSGRTIFEGVVAGGCGFSALDYLVQGKYFVAGSLALFSAILGWNVRRSKKIVNSATSQLEAMANKQ